MIKRHIKFFTIVSCAILVRLFFASFPPFKSDMDSFIAWGEQMLMVGPGRFYKSGIWSDYAPGYMYFMWLVAAIKHTFFSSASRELYELLHKSVPMLFDILTGVLLYKIMRYISRKYATSEKINMFYLPEIVAGLYMLSPFTILTSAAWGQVDSVYVFFLLLSFYYVLKKQLPIACSIFVVAAVIKPQAVVLAPLYLLLFIKEWNWMLFAQSALYAIITFYVLTMPFFGISALSGMWGLLQNSVDVYPYSSINTFNYWGIMGFWKPDTTVYLFGMTQRVFGYLVWGLTLVGGFYFGIRALYSPKKQLIEKNAALLATYFVFSAVMFMTRMHERYLYPLFVYFILFAGLYTFHYLNSEKRSKKDLRLVLLVWVLFILTMLLHSLNLYYVYVFYLYFLAQPRINVPTTNTFYYFVESYLTTWSYIQLLVYGIFVVSAPYYIRRLVHEHIKK